MPIHLSQKEFAGLVRRAIRSLPPEFAAQMENVSVDIQPRASAALGRRMGLDRGEELLGYYDGVPLTEKSVSRPYEMPGRIIVFQRAIEDICETDEDVVEEVRLTVLHEIGHHFGMDEDDLEEFGY